MTPMPSPALGFSLVLIGATGVGLHVLYAVRCSILIGSQSPRDEGSNGFLAGVDEYASASKSFNFNIQMILFSVKVFDLFISSRYLSI